MKEEHKYKILLINTKYHNNGMKEFHIKNFNKEVRDK